MQDHDKIITEVRKQIDRTRTKIQRLYQNSPPRELSGSRAPADFRSNSVEQYDYNPRPYNNAGSGIGQQFSQFPASGDPIQRGVVNAQVYHGRGNYYGPYYPAPPQMRSSILKDNHELPEIESTAPPSIYHKNSQLSQPNPRLQTETNTIYEQSKSSSHKYRLKRRQTEESFGNEHNFKIMRIINQKEMEDRQNEEILVRFRREAEEYKKERSEQKRRLRSLAAKHRKEEDEATCLRKINNNSKLVSEDSSRVVGEMQIQPIVSFHETVKSRYQVNGSFPPQKVEFLTDSLHQSEGQITPSPSSRNLFPRTTQILPPVTDEGEDGLKYIRKNLSLQKHTPPTSKNPPPRTHTNPETLAPLQPSDQNQFLDIAVVNPFQLDNRILASKKVENLDNIRVNPPKIKANNIGFRVRKDKRYSTVESCNTSTNNVMKLSEVFT